MLKLPYLTLPYLTESGSVTKGGDAQCVVVGTSRDGTTQVSRRRMVKAMGAGAGLAVLSPVGSIIAKETPDVVVHGKLPTLDRGLIKKLQVDMKDAIRDYRKGFPGEALNTANEALQRLFAHYDDVGLTSFLQTNVDVAVESFTPFEADPDIKEKADEVGITDDELRRLSAIAQTELAELSRQENTNVREMMNEFVTKSEILQDKVNQNSGDHHMQLYGAGACAASVLTAIGLAIAGGATCAACTADPTKVSCAVCVGTAVGAVGAGGTAANNCL